MKALALALLFLSTNVFALDAVVVVLEAPYFRTPSEDSPVVQYARKGDVIKIHPSVANTDKYNYLAPEQKKLSAVRKELKKRAEWNEDPMFKGDVDDFYTIQDNFIPVLDRQGKRAYVKKEHIYVYFNDTREFAQHPHPGDETDYRLEEPLPKNYPLPNRTGYRGQFLFGVLQPYYETYPYLSPVKSKGYSSPLDFTAALMKEADEEKQDRFYFGGMANIRHHRNAFSFTNGSKSTEENYKFGIGPYVSYDAFKGMKDRVNLSAAINTYLLNFTTISQTNLAGKSDNRTYQAFTVAPRIGLQYHRKGIFPEIDFVAGTGMEMELPSTYHAKNGAKVDGLWRNNGNDSFQTRTVWNISAYFGIQSAY
ncbi:MAG: hypothetical protein ACJ76H_01840 [Bacteriovoracaceae bacterium]